MSAQRPLFLLIFCCLFASILSAQEIKYMVSGSFNRLNPENKKIQAYLIQTGSNSYKIDSTIIEKGAFNFSGNIASPALATLIIDHAGHGMNAMMTSKQVDFVDFLVIYLEKTPVIIRGTDSLSLASVKGGIINDENREFQLLQSGIQDSTRKLIFMVHSAKPEQQNDQAFQRVIQEKYNTILASNRRLICQFALQHPSSMVSLDQLYNTFSSMPDASQASLAFGGLDKSLKNTVKGTELGSLINTSKLTELGALAPEITQADTTGKMISLSAFRGKYVLLDFWASWCKPCRLENPNVVRAFRSYSTKNFTVFGVSLDQPSGMDNWKAAIKEDQLSWTQVSDLKFWSNAAARLYGVRSIPQNFLLDPAGKIIAHNLTGEDLDNFLAKIFRTSNKNK